MCLQNHSNYKWNIRKAKGEISCKRFWTIKGCKFWRDIAPTIKQEMEKIAMGLASQYGWQMEHLDVKAIVVFCDNQTSW